MTMELSPGLVKYIKSRQVFIDSHLASKPSPQAFGIGDEVIVVYPPSKYFKQTGEVTDLNYLEASVRKGYSDYTVTVKFPDGGTRKFLMGRVRAVGFASEPQLSSYLEGMSGRYARSRKMRQLKRELGEKYFESPEYLKLLTEGGR